MMQGQGLLGFFVQDPEARTTHHITLFLPFLASLTPDGPEYIPHVM